MLKSSSLSPSLDLLLIKSVVTKMLGRNEFKAAFLLYLRQLKESRKTFDDEAIERKLCL